MSKDEKRGSNQDWKKSVVEKLEKKHKELEDERVKFEPNTSFWDKIKIYRKKRKEVRLKNRHKRVVKDSIIFIFIYLFLLAVFQELIYIRDGIDRTVVLGEDQLLAIDVMLPALAIYLIASTFYRLVSLALNIKERKLFKTSIVLFAIMLFLFIGWFGLFSMI